MKFSLANLLLVVAVVAVAIGWWGDHARLRNANARLNAEAAALFQEVRHHDPQTFIALEFPNGELPPSRAYDFSLPEDRAEYRKTYGHIGRTSGDFMASNLMSSPGDR